MRDLKVVVERLEAGRMVALAEYTIPAGHAAMTPMIGDDVSLEGSGTSYVVVTRIFCYAQGCPVKLCIAVKERP